jgi:hypothetical protein
MSLVGAALVCLVVGVSDGDTLTGRCTLEGGQAETIKIWLAEVDAPEKGQAFGDRGKRHRVAMCFGHMAHVQVDSTDRYGRSAAHTTSRSPGRTTRACDHPWLRLHLQHVCNDQAWLLCRIFIRFKTGTRLAPASPRKQKSQQALTC